ncbi:MAG: sigma-70 family RNA polymerase sigma factor [Bryobacterales bacterium]|nr:sigma-70 family RNA polymerase sigma factor [Bryobacterales bacterium]
MQNNGINNVDDLLVARARSGDRDAFEELTRKYYDSSLKLALYLLRNREEAEDEVQNAYSKAFQNIHLFREEAKFSTWITRIVLNCCLMRMRKLKRVRVRPIEDTMPGEETITALQLTDERPSPEDSLGRTQILSRLQYEMRRIPPLLRNVLELRDLKELPMPEVAEQLGISVPAAKSRLLRARQELRNRMEKHCGRLGPATLVA